MASLGIGLGLMPVTSARASTALTPATPPNPAAVATTSTAAYSPLATPRRVYDTRVSGGGFSAGETRDIDLASAAAALGAVSPTAVVVNVTVLGPAPSGYWTVWPTGAPRPDASSINIDDVASRFGPSLALSNLVTVPLSSSSVSAFASSGGDLLVDVVGFYVPSVSSGAGRLQPLAAPTRIYDTRGATPFLPGERRDISIPGAGGAQAVVLNVTVIGLGSGYWQVYPSGGATPSTSNVNTAALGDLVANNVITRVSAGGGITVAAEIGGHLIVDLVAVFTGTDASVGTDGLFVALASPTRLLDTRRTTRPHAKSAVEVDVVSTIGRSDISAVVMNATVTETPAAGYVSVTSAGSSAIPEDRSTSSLNATHSNETLANHVIVPVSTRGFDVFTQGGGHLIADVSGYFTGQPTAAVHGRHSYPAPTTPLGCVGTAQWPVGPIGFGTGPDDVRRLQGRLLELGFWNLGPDGEYGLSTKQAVMAFQKWAGLPPTTVTDVATAEALNLVQCGPVAGRPTGDYFEVDKTRQLAFVVRGGRVLFTFNVSTGNGLDYDEEDRVSGGRVTGVAITPTGEFRVYKERDEAEYKGTLGTLYRPKFVVGGIAVHGSPRIPAYPASHGCIRVANPVMDFIWFANLLPRRAKVWIHD